MQISTLLDNKVVQFQRYIIVKPNAPQWYGYMAIHLIINTL